MSSEISPPVWACPAVIESRLLGEVVNEPWAAVVKPMVKSLSLTSPPNVTSRGMAGTESANAMPSDLRNCNSEIPVAPSSVSSIEADGAKPTVFLSSSLMTSSMLFLVESISQVDEGKPVPSDMVMVTLFSPPEVGMLSSTALKEPSAVLPLESVVLEETVCSMDVKLVAATSPLGVMLMVTPSDPLVASGVPSEFVSKPSSAKVSPSANCNAVSAKPILFLLAGVDVFSAIGKVRVTLPAVRQPKFCGKFKLLAPSAYATPSSVKTASLADGDKPLGYEKVTS